MDRNNIVTKHYNECARDLIKYFSSRNDNNIMDGEDIVHTAYTRSLKYFYIFETANITFTKWFNSILTNVYRDFLREKRGRGVSEDIDDVSDSLVNDADEVCLDTTQNFGLILKAIEESLLDHHNVLRLFYVYQYGIMDIANLLDGYNYKRVDNILMKFRRDFIKSYGE